MFSMTNGLPKTLPSRSDRSRPSTSGLPPGAAPAMTRIGRFGPGSSCASDGWAKVSASPIPSPKASPAMAAIRPVIAILPTWFFGLPGRASGLAPDLHGQLDHEAQLVLLHLRRDRIAGVDAGEAAL